MDGSNPEDEPPGSAFDFLLKLTRPPDPVIYATFVGILETLRDERDE